MGRSMTAVLSNRMCEALLPPLHGSKAQPRSSTPEPLALAVNRPVSGLSTPAQALLTQNPPGLHASPESYWGSNKGWVEEIGRGVKASRNASDH